MKDLHVVVIILGALIFWNAYDIERLKKDKSHLTKAKIDAYDYLLVDHEKEINALKRKVK
jgi:hypothetical protein